jgi:phosphatidate phosphatase APP1
MAWKKKVLQIASKVDEQVDMLKALLKQRLGGQDSWQIVPYRTYGTVEHIYVRGRLLEQQRIGLSNKQDSLWNNLVNMYRRFETDEVPGVTIQLQVQDHWHQTITDREGYFVFDLHLATTLISNHLYHTFPLVTQQADRVISAEAEVMIPSVRAGYGIISDIDDTIIQTGATDIIGMLKTVMLTNAHTRLPLEGVAEFYQQLQKGATGLQQNPFFYVSSSPWNLYDLLTDFMDLHHIPQGPLLLRDFGISNEDFMTHDYLGHKFTAIKQILDTYPKLNFVLIGDSGEKDPGIYYEVVKAFSGRILSVYIRDVDQAEKRIVALDIAEQMKAFGVEMVVSNDSRDMAAHALKSGLIK